MISAPAPYGGCGIQHTSMITAQYFDGQTSFSVNALAGDQIYLVSKATILDDFFTGSPDFALRIEGDFVTSTYGNSSAVSGGINFPASLNYVYDVPEDMEVNFEFFSGEDYGIEEIGTSVLVLSNDVVEVDTPALNVGIGFGLFLATMFFFVWFFRSKRN